MTPIATTIIFLFCISIFTIVYFGLRFADLFDEIKSRLDKILDELSRHD